MTHLPRGTTPPDPRMSAALGMVIEIGGGKKKKGVSLCRIKFCGNVPSPKIVYLLYFQVATEFAALSYSIFIQRPAITIYMRLCLSDTELDICGEELHHHLPPADRLHVTVRQSEIAAPGGPRPSRPHPSPLTSLLVTSRIVLVTSAMTSPGDGRYIRKDCDRA